jgi:hypothetical protein
MGIIRQNPQLKRQLRIMSSTLRVSEKRDMRDTSTGKVLMSKGYISKSNGKITEKGKKALRLF